MKKVDHYSKVVVYGLGLVVSAIILGTTLVDGTYPVAVAAGVGVLLFGRGLKKKLGW